ncbi:hypothetical protein GGD56_007132 [Rhizobium mongolense]|uniref:Uncharacterized protein n=1 Tax=Rhizobium mongolense TaxID=57676 RepID=A0ABR6IZ91_9HYPH|nr:hypothetical protein [Rhizobium mongolense]
MPVVDAVEILREIRVDHPSLASVHNAVAQYADGVMRRPSGRNPSEQSRKSSS